MPGVIGNVIGDLVMGFFAPINVMTAGQSDFRHNALDSALEIFRTVGYGSTEGRLVRLAIGLECGPALVGKVGREGVYRFTALGDTVNVAARLQEHAVAGEILLADSVYGAVAADYPGLAHSKIAAQRKSIPMQVHHLRIGEPQDELKPAS